LFAAAKTFCLRDTVKRKLVARAGKKSLKSKRARKHFEHLKKPFALSRF
jgi:hypothetical protein